MSLLIICVVRDAGQVIEVGVPFTDPMADGTTIQRANEVASATNPEKIRVWCISACPCVIHTDTKRAHAHTHMST